MIIGKSLNVYGRNMSSHEVRDVLSHLITILDSNAIDWVRVGMIPAIGIIAACEENINLHYIHNVNSNMTKFEIAYQPPLFIIMLLLKEKG